jgi:hypothetical protein
VNALTPVSFKKGREFKPRLSPPREPGRTSERYFSEYEKCVIRSHYPDGGAAGCMARLEGRSQAQIQRQAHALGVRFKGVGERRVFARPDDETIRARWAELNGRGAVQRLADELGVPRHWLSARAIRLGPTTPHKKEPPWSEAEDALMRRAPLHDPRRAARLFAEHGFSRSPTAIVVRAKRLELSRRAARGVYSAMSAARLLGTDVKTVTAWILAGDIAATRRADARLPQQGGSAFDIDPAELRRFIVDSLGRIDIRRVDKFAFVALIAGEPGETNAAHSPADAAAARGRD